MATVHRNLSSYDPSNIPSGEGKRFGLVVSEWNADITTNLLNGAVETMLSHGVRESDIYISWVPGSFELPLGSQWLFEQQQPDAVIAIGVVIQGETRHFDFVCAGVTQGIMEVGLKFNKPCIFCVLTDLNMQQSIDRSGGKHGNKGVECALAALKMVQLS